jgi:hypothetical protein
VTGYSASDLAAILGASAGPADSGDGDDGTLAPGEVRAVHPEDSDASSAGHVSGQEGDGDDEAEAVSGRSAAKRDGSVGQAPDEPKRWWSGQFVRAGSMGSTKHELKSRKVHTAAAGAAADSAAKAAAKVAGFSEQDQEDLYTKVRSPSTWGTLADSVVPRNTCSWNPGFINLNSWGCS